MAEYQMTAQQHFNGGFFDAQNDRAAGRTKRDVADHFNQPYSFGYLAGWIADRTDDSSEAWADHQRAVSRAIEVVQDTGRTFGFQINSLDGSCYYMAGGYASANIAHKTAVTKLRNMVATHLIQL